VGTEPAEGRRLYPISLDVAGRRVVVVGGGRVAERKVEGLLAAGAAVAVIAPEATAALQQLAAARRITLDVRGFEDGDVAGAILAFAATADETVNARVREAAQNAGVPLNDAQDGGRSDFTVPAVHRAGAVALAVDTAGLAPAFAKRVRDDLATVLDGRYARAAQTLGRMRAYALYVLAPTERAAVMARLASADLDELATMSPSAAEDAVDRASGALRAADAANSAARPLVCATRGSALAIWQARYAMTRLAERGVASIILEVATMADRVQDRPLTALGDDGVFVKELELALREHRADYAVHSCKDLPSKLPGDMRIAAIGSREDPRDAFCSERFATFAELPAGAVVGTSSPRRIAQLRALRADLRYEPIRGNVDTRLRKLREGQYDAIVLAMAGLMRLGLQARHTLPFAAEDVLPAPGQGALAVECRAGDFELAEFLNVALADPATERCVAAERAFLGTLLAGCEAPLGAFATQLSDERIGLAGLVASVDGSRVLRASRSGPAATVLDAVAIGTALAEDLLADGAAALLRPASARPLDGKLFLLPRTQARDSRIAPALRSAGAEVIEAPDSRAATTALGGRVPDVLLFPSSGAVDAIAEYLEGLRTRRPRPIVATMGTHSSQTARGRGFPPDVVAPEPAVASFVHSVTHYVLEKAAES
jgi:hydroxymethylbilane synthase